MTTPDAADGAFDTLVIRVWSEPTLPHRFRARIIFGDETHTVATEATSDPEEVVLAVRRWLTDRRHAAKPST